VDAGFDQNEAELAILILTVALEVLADGDGLLDQHVKVLWDLRGEAIGLEDAEDLVSGDDPDLRDTVAIPQDNTNLGRRGALPSELADLLDDLLGRGFEPGRDRARVRSRGGGDTFSVRVKTTHFVFSTRW